MNNKEKFEKYADLLREWSHKINLVAPSTLECIEQRHFADSAQLAEYLPSNVLIADLGAGAGFPGVILAILGWEVIAIESIGKKANFLKTLKTELDLPNLTIFHGRAEDFIKNLKKTGKKLVFSARAFAPLVKILDYVAHTKSRLFLLKGRDIDTEVLAAKQNYTFDYKLYPSKTGDGFIVIIDKVSQKKIA
ncbi:MAG: 16S rRNA (guanine(527)-N(7))-methyltransferase RsmG [Rickettsiales bacterium]|jgi:16S rRNA (guanine527-N7)-methyltransferase|nr:16S rRNA (guanine(527)-N(7))-methyltransferase RsmG [Rickettsiales bacterium]